MIYHPDFCFVPRHREKPKHATRVPKEGNTQYVKAAAVDPVVRKKVKAADRIWVKWQGKNPTTRKIMQKRPNPLVHGRGWTPYLNFSGIPDIACTNLYKRVPVAWKDGDNLINNAFWHGSVDTVSTPKQLRDNAGSLGSYHRAVSNWRYNPTHAYAGARDFCRSKMAEL
jgi:hypothetical protein